MPRHITGVQRRWADLDPYGHVNNVVYLRYLQEARVDMLFVDAARRGAEELASGVVVIRHEVDYLAPVRFQARPLLVETWVREVRNSAFTLGYEVLDGDDDQRHVYARASSTLVPYNLSADRPRRVAAEEKVVLEGYLEPDGPRPRAGRGQPAGGTGGEPPRAIKEHIYTCAVRFDDLDSYGHVNNVTFVEYLQEARIDFAQRHLTDVGSLQEGMAVAGLAVDYLTPVPFRTEPLRVHVWVTRIGTSSLDIAGEVRDDDHVYARASTTLVGFDIDTQQSRSLTTAERAAMEPFLVVAS